MTDDMGYADPAPTDVKIIPPPNIDALCARGMKFINAYAAAPVCTPTSTAFITSHYPARTPVELKKTPHNK